jgi:hypothetical protein
VFHFGAFARGRRNGHAAVPAAPEKEAGRLGMPQRSEIMLQCEIPVEISPKPSQVELQAKRSRQI